MNKYQKSLIDFMETGEIEIKLRHLSQRQLIRLVEEQQQRIDIAIEILSEDFTKCPISLTFEKSYIIEQNKIEKALNTLKGSESDD